MAVTVQSFVQRFPEFSEAPESLIEDCLEEAEIMVDRNFWGTSKADIGVRYLAAHLIAINPLGEYAKLAPDEVNGKTTYLVAFEKVKKSLGAGCRLI